MSRLLFAAARGARVQFFAEQSHRYEWMHIERVPLKEPQAKFYRIHPDDAHLQYGPVSTALRDPDDCHETVGRYPLLALHVSCTTDLSWTWNDDWDNEEDELARSLFLLILAEALADKGL